MPEITLHLNSPADTETVAAILARSLAGGEYLSLEGNLGAGKTFFTRAMAKALGVAGPVTSPTFVLQKIYATTAQPIITHIYHYDLYRISSYEELLDLGFEDAPETAITLAEWGDKFAASMPKPLIRLRLDRTGENTRGLHIGGGLCSHTLNLLRATQFSA